MLNSNILVKTIPLLLIFLSFTLQLGQCETMKCYVCSSTNDKDCIDSPTADKFVVDCDKYFADHNDTYTPKTSDFICRKTVETGSTFEGEPGEMRVIRSCGDLRNDKGPCYKTRDPQVKTETCECFSPLCNSAQSLSSSMLIKLFILPAILTILTNLS